jgi:hypothetical protein
VGQITLGGKDHVRWTARVRRAEMRIIDGQAVPFVFRIPDRTADVSLMQNWIPISLTN